MQLFGLLVVALVCLGCTHREVTPSPARQTLDTACYNDSNIDACAAIENLDAQEMAREHTASERLYRSGMSMLYGGGGAY